MSDARRHTLGIAVPVRNEAAMLPGFLDALGAQRGGHAFILCVVLDGCDDESAAIVAAAKRDGRFPISSVATGSSPPNAGLARGRAMDLALAQLAGDDAVVISTDADSTPDPDWLTNNVDALMVADVAAGRIVRDGDGPSVVQDRVERYYDGLHVLRRTIDPVPWEAARTHHFTSGASLAFRAGVYRSLGGFRPLPSAEDARLVDAAHRAGHRVRRDAAITVTTSSRRTGRAQGGLADHLRLLDAEGGNHAPTMAHPADVAWRYAGHASARAAWGALDRLDARLADALGRPLADIRRIAEGAPNAEAFAMRVVPEIDGGERLVTLDVAEHALAALTGRSSVAA